MRDVNFTTVQESIRNNLLRAFIVALLATLSFSAAPAAFADTKLTVSSIPAEFVISGPSPEEEFVSVDVTLTSESPKRILVTFVDYFTGEDGKRLQLPGGSTPYSLQNVLEVQEFDNLHRGGGLKQEFTVIFRPKPGHSKSVFSGGVSIGTGPDGEAGEGIGSSGAITRTMTVTPFGIAADLVDGSLQAAKFVRHDLERLERSSFFDSILPDIPGVVNYGPVESRVEYKNSGDYPVFYSLRWNFLSGAEPIASRTFPATLLNPEQSGAKAVTTQVDAVGKDLKLNVLPSFGFVENKITLTSSLGGTEFPVETYDGSFLVLQWKEPFVALLAIYFLVRWAWRKNLSKRKREESASLFWLALRDFNKKLARRRTIETHPLTNAPLAGPQNKIAIPKGSTPKPLDLGGSLGLDLEKTKSRS